MSNGIGQPNENAIYTDYKDFNSFKLSTLKVDKEVTPLTSLVTFIKTKVTSTKITVPQIILLFAEGAKYLEALTELSGDEKKRYLISAIKEVSVELNATPEELMLVDLVSSSVVDSLIELGKNTILFVKSRFSSLVDVLCLLRSICIGSRYTQVKPEVTPEVEAELTQILSMGAPITKDKIIMLLVAGIKFMQAAGNFNGASKKAVVIKVIHSIIDKTVKEDDKSDMHNALDLVGSNFIDVAVEFGQDFKTFVHTRCL
jgi:hypothetical protein